MNELRNYLEQRFDKMDEKLDNHLERLARAEADIGWLRGFTKTFATLVVAAVGTTIGWVLTKI